MVNPANTPLVTPLTSTPQLLLPANQPTNVLTAVENATHWITVLKKAATCFKCGRNGHYANLCLGGKKPSINTINETDDASTYLLSLDATCNSVTFPKPVVNAIVQPLTAPHCTNIPLKVDTGADVLIISKTDGIPTLEDPELSDLQKSSIVLTTFGGSDIVSLGSTTVKVTVKGHTCNISFIVTETLAPNILSYKDSIQLNLV